jgi:hypothetical protein
MKKPVENVKTIDASKIQILPLYDWHLGSEECNEDLVDRIIDYIKKTPNCFTFLGGDLIECCVYGKMNNVHTQKYQVTEQVEMLVKKLKPIKDKILFSICGNHEQRIEKATGLDISALIALNLEVPYHQWESHFQIKLNSHKKKGDKKNVYIYAHHGSGGGGSSGGKINSAEKFHFRAPFANAIFVGHVHFTSTTRKLLPYITQTGVLKNMTQYIISCGTAHESNGYAAMKGYGPQPTGLMLAKFEINHDDVVKCHTEVFE